MAKCKQEKGIRASADADLAALLRKEVAEANEHLYDAKRRLREQLQFAARVHRTLLPTAVEHARVHVDVRYLPLDTLSGDYFQVRFPDDKSLCYMTMCHVTGDGIAPALLASRISSEARHYIEEEYCPSDMVHALNCFIYEYFRDIEMEVTFMVARIQLDQRTITYSGAGHPGGLVLRPGEGLLHQLVSQHCSIGVNPEILVRESESTLPLAIGDRLLLVSEGVMQTHNAEHEQLGQNRLARIALGAMSCGVYQMLDVMVGDVCKFCGGPVGKDIAIIVAEIK